MRLWEDRLVVAVVLAEAEEEELAIGIDKKQIEEFDIVKSNSSDTMWSQIANWYCAALPNTMKALCIYKLIIYRVCVLTYVHEEFEFKYTKTKMLSMSWVVVILAVIL